MSRVAKKTGEVIQDIHTLSNNLHSQVLQLESLNPKLSDKVRETVRRRVSQIVEMIDELNRTYNFLLRQPPER
jgi:hypothetical protein